MVSTTTELRGGVVRPEDGRPINSRMRHRVDTGDAEASIEGHRSSSRLARVSAAALVAALALGACGSDKGDPTVGGDVSDGETPAEASGGATDPAQAEWPEDHCGIVSEDAVGGIVGEAVTAEDFPPFGCQYLGDSNGVVIDYFSIAAECEGAEARTDDPEIVDDLGVHAAFVSANIDEALAVTLENGLCFFVHGTYGGETDNDAARIAIAEEIIASS